MSCRYHAYVDNLDPCRHHEDPATNLEKEEHQKDIQIEKDRRLADLTRLRDEHNQTLEEVRSGYVNAMEKVMFVVTYSLKNIAISFILF